MKFTTNTICGLTMNTLGVVFLKRQVSLLFFVILVTFSSCGGSGTKTRKTDKVETSQNSSVHNPYEKRYPRQTLLTNLENQTAYNVSVGSYFFREDPIEQKNALCYLFSTFDYLDAILTIKNKGVPNKKRPNITLSLIDLINSKEIFIDSSESQSSRYIENLNGGYTETLITKIVQGEFPVYLTPRDRGYTADIDFFQNKYEKILNSNESAQGFLSLLKEALPVKPNYELFSSDVFYKFNKSSLENLSNEKIALFLQDFLSVGVPLLVSIDPPDDTNRYFFKTNGESFDKFKYLQGHALIVEGLEIKRDSSQELISMKVYFRNSWASPYNKFYFESFLPNGNSLRSIFREIFVVVPQSINESLSERQNEQVLSLRDFIVPAKEIRPRRSVRIVPR